MEEHLKQTLSEDSAVRVVAERSLGADAPRIDQTKAWFRIEVRRSTIHRWGVFALEAIPARRRVIEYTGEKISLEEHERRGLKGFLYRFTLSDKWVIDPTTTGGSGAQYINHSCDGNLEAHGYGGHIYLSSLRRIEPGEELNYDYNIQGDYKIRCRCGTANYRGWLQAP